MNDRTAILREWFDRVDFDKTGSIAALQLKRALAVGNLDIAVTVIEQMIRMYDFDRNGTMSFEEFLALNKFLLKVQHAFSDLERGQGYLSSHDVYEALVKMGISLDSPAFYTLCEMGIASAVHLFVFPAKPYEWMRDGFRGSVSILGDYASVDCPVDPGEVRDSKRPTKLRLPQPDIDVKSGMTLTESVRDVLVGSGEYLSLAAPSLHSV